MILYFSGTGNSRYAAELLSEQLNEELLDLGKRIKSGEKSPIFSTGPWVFVSPTYGWQLPHIFEEYLRAVELLGDKRAYFVLTCGSDIGGAGRYLAELCQAKGLIYRGTLEVVMPENYIALFPVPEEQEAEQIIQKVRDKLARHREEGGLRVSSATGTAEGNGIDILKIVHDADERMYEDKKRGKESREYAMFYSE